MDENFTILRQKGFYFFGCFPPSPGYDNLLAFKIQINNHKPYTSPGLFKI